MPIHIYIYILF